MTQLTAREQAVLHAISHGKPDRVIALELHLSVQSVKGTVKRLRVKLRARNRTHAVAIAYRTGLLPAMGEAV